jgi:hypothetical protein
MSDSHLHDLAAQLVSAHQGTDVSDCIPGTFRPLQLGQLCNLQHSVDKMILFRLFQLQCAWLRGTELSESARHGESNCTPAPAAHSRPPQPHLEHRPPGHGHHRCRSRQPWTLIDHSSVLFRQGDTSHDWLEAFQVEQARACTKACESLHTASHGYVKFKPLACKGQLHDACAAVPSCCCVQTEGAQYGAWLRTTRWTSTIHLFELREFISAKRAKRANLEHIASVLMAKKPEAGGHARGSLI